jgi:hypothetical protein
MFSSFQFIDSFLPGSQGSITICWNIHVEILYLQAFKSIAKIIIQFGLEIIRKVLIQHLYWMWNKPIRSWNIVLENINDNEKY